MPEPKSPKFCPSLYNERAELIMATTSMEFLLVLFIPLSISMYSERGTQTMPKKLSKS